MSPASVSFKGPSKMIKSHHDILPAMLLLPSEVV